MANFRENRIEAVKGSSSFSIYMAGGRHRYHSPAETNWETEGNYQANRIHTIVDYGTIYGKRLYSDILIYGRYSQIFQDSHGKISFPKNANLDRQDFELTGLHSSFGLGVMWFTPKINIGLEFTILKTKWEQSSNTNANSLLLNFSKDLI